MILLGAGGSKNTFEPRPATSAEQIEIHFFFLLFHDLLLLCLCLITTTGCGAITAASPGSCTTATAAACAAAHFNERFHTDGFDHLRNEHRPITLNTAACGFDHVVHVVRFNLSTIVVENEASISAKQLILLLLRKLACWNTGHLTTKICCPPKRGVTK